MQSAIQLTPAQTLDFLLNVAVVRPVFLWRPPGIGKSALVRRFADAVGLECVSLLGSQLAPEDLLGIPKIDALQGLPQADSAKAHEPDRRQRARRRGPSDRVAGGALAPHAGPLGAGHPFSGR